MVDHIVKSYDSEIKELRSVISRMGGLVEDQLTAAMQALTECDVEAAQRIRRQDRHIDELELLVEQTAVSIFARRAPVADDLREIISSLKMSSVLERAGDYAKNIAKRTVAIAGEKPVAFPQTLDRMTDLAREMLRDVMDAYVRRNTDAALDVWYRDEQLDSLHNTAYRQILARMMEMPDHIGTWTHLLMIAKNLERIGDQATNLAEQVYYSVKGTLLEDTRPKHDLTSDIVESATTSAKPGTAE